MPHEDAAVLVARGLHVRAVHKESRSADFVASTDTIDSYDEIVDQASWDLARYQRNPVVLWAHDSRELPIGKASAVEVKDGELHCSVSFASAAANPMAEHVWQSIQEGTLRAVSVGFSPKTYRYEKRGDRDVLVLADNELFEISVTPIPANPDALMKMRAKAQQATNAGESGAIKDTHMAEDQKEIASLKSALAEKDGAVATLTKQLGDERAKNEALAAQNTKLAEERDAAKKDAEALLEKGIDAEVEKLVGVKITPAEKASFVRLRKADPALFEEMVKQRSPLPISGKSPVTEDTRETSSPASTDESADMVNDAMKRARGAA